MPSRTQRAAAGAAFWIEKLNEAPGAFVYAELTRNRIGELEIRFVCDWLQDGKYMQVKSQRLDYWMPSKLRQYEITELLLLNLHRERSEKMMGLGEDETIGDLELPPLPF